MVSASRDYRAIARLQSITCTHSRTHFRGVYEGLRGYLLAPETKATTIIIACTSASIWIYNESLLGLHLLVGRDEWATGVINLLWLSLTTCIQAGIAARGIFLNQWQDWIFRILSLYIPALAVILTVCLSVISQFEPLHEGLVFRFCSESGWALGSFILTTLHADVLSAVNRFTHKKISVEEWILLERVRRARPEFLLSSLYMQFLLC